MKTKLVVDDIEIEVDEKVAEDLRTKLERLGATVSDLGNFEDTAYEFSTYIEKAKEHANEKPPDILQFSEMVWGAASFCVRKFYLKNFSTLVKSHDAKGKMLKAICAGLKDAKEGADVMSYWINAEKSHAIFYNNDFDFVTKENQAELLKSIEEMAKLIKSTDVNKVSDELQKLNDGGSVTFSEGSKQKYQLGKKPYKYTWIAY